MVKGPTLGCVAIASIVNLDNQHWAAVCWKGGVVSVFDLLLIAERVKIPRVEAKTGTHTQYANCESGEKAGVPATKISQDQSPHTSHDSGRPVIVGPQNAHENVPGSRPRSSRAEKTSDAVPSEIFQTVNTGFQCVSCGRVAHDRCVAPERRTSKVCAECAPSKRATASAKRTATLIEKRQDALRCTKCDRPICAKAISCRICGRQFHVGCLSQPRRKTETCTDCVPQKRGKTMTNQHQDGEPGKDDTGKALRNDKLPKMRFISKMSVRRQKRWA